MRVNIYEEEITERVELVRKTADTGASFIGLRFYLESSPKLHHSKGDDDSSAVTFWIRSGKKGFRKGDELELAHLLREAHRLLLLEAVE